MASRACGPVAIVQLRSYSNKATQGAGAVTGVRMATGEPRAGVGIPIRLSQGADRSSVCFANSPWPDRWVSGRRPMC